jgi:hypothetical protein
MDEGEPRRHPVRCSFCGKRQDQVRKLVAGPSPSVYICERCIRLRNEIVDEDARSGGCKSAPTGTPTRGRSSIWRRLRSGEWRVIL